MGSCCGYVKTDNSKTIVTSSSNKKKEQDIEDTLKGLKEDQGDQIPLKLSKQEKTITKKTSV